MYFDYGFLLLPQLSLDPSCHPAHSILCPFSLFQKLHKTKNQKKKKFKTKQNKTTPPPPTHIFLHWQIGHGHEDCLLYTQWQSIEENWLSFCQWVSIANNLVKGVSQALLPHLSWEPVCLDPVQVLWMLPQFLCVGPVVSEDAVSLESSITSGSGSHILYETRWGLGWRRLILDWVLQCFLLSPRCPVVGLCVNFHLLKDPSLVKAEQGTDLWYVIR